MQDYTTRTTSKAGQFLAEMERSRLSSVWAGDAARYMKVQRKQVASLLGPLVRKGFLRMVWEKDGQHYVRADRLEIAIDEPWVTLAVMADPDGTDWYAEFVKVRRNWVSAAGLPPPVTTAPRSVFELGQRLGGM